MPKLKLTKTKLNAGIEPLLTTKEAAQIVGVSASFLNNDRYIAGQENTSPKFPYIKLPSGGIRYRASDLKAVIEAGYVGA